MYAILTRQSEGRSKRLSREERRRQMLGVAKDILRTKGADALTLGGLAQRAGVSKPVAYDHFETRSGLLLALLEEANNHYENDARTRIADAPQTVAAIGAIVSETYIACALEAGPAISVLIAAIDANGEVQDAGRAFRASHAEQFNEAFASALPDNCGDLSLLFTGLIAAADAICAELTSGRITAATATQMLTHLLTASLESWVQEIPQERKSS